VIFHRHQWVETSRRFNPPQVDVKRWEGHRTDLVMRLVYGITVVELRCDTCGDVKATSYAGEAR
jgi:hypothetical protein